MKTKNRKTKIDKNIPALLTGMNEEYVVSKQNLDKFGDNLFKIAENDTLKIHPNQTDDASILRRIAEIDALSVTAKTDLITAIKDLTAVLKSFDSKIFNIVNTNDTNKTQTITYT